MKVTQVMLMAVIMSISFAWTTNYTPTSTTYSVLSAAFSLLESNETSWTFGGINTSGLTVGETVQYEDRIKLYAECDNGAGSSCTDLSTGAWRIPWGAPNQAANISFSSGSDSAACSHGSGSSAWGINITNSSGSNIVASASGFYSFVFNATEANMSNATASFIIPRDHRLSLFAYRSCSLGTGSTNPVLMNWTKYNAAHPYQITQNLSKFSSVSGTKPQLVNLMGTTMKVGITNPYSVLVGDYSTGGAISNASAYCPTYLYFSSTAIQPVISYFPASAAAYPSLYNATTGEALLMNNTIAYVLDDTTRLWYVVPAFTCDPSLHYTSAVLYYATANGTTSNFTAPLIPNNFYCNFNGSIYNIYSSYTNPVTHTVYYNNGTNFNSTSQVSADFSFTVNTVDYSSINYTVNGNTLCSYSGNATGIFPNIIPLTGTSSVMYKYIGILLFIFALAISTVVPFGLIFVVLINDFFQYVGPGEMVGLCIVTAFVSFFNTHKGFITLKTIAMYACIGAAILAFYYGYAGFSVAPLNNITNSFNTLTQDPQYTNLPAMVYAGAAFIIQFVTLIITLPALLIDALMAAILAASPAFYNALHSGGAVMSIENALKIAFLAWVYLKGYEVLANRYNLV